VDVKTNSSNISGNFNNSGAATDILLHWISPGYAWDGTIYIDDVQSN
jgi:hypothetical protein